MVDQTQALCRANQGHDESRCHHKGNDKPPCLGKTVHLDTKHDHPLRWPDIHEALYCKAIQTDSGSIEDNAKRINNQPQGFPPDKAGTTLVPPPVMNRGA
jgi:hypothetical protein